jgi:hypothetical protein
MLTALMPLASLLDPLRPEWVDDVPPVVAADDDEDDEEEEEDSDDDRDEDDDDDIGGLEAPAEPIKQIDDFDEDDFDDDFDDDFEEELDDDEEFGSFSDEGQGGNFEED